MTALLLGSTGWMSMRDKGMGFVDAEILHPSLFIFVFAEMLYLAIECQNR